MVQHYNPQIHHRRSIRLKSYDYNQAGAYFVTICVQNRECLLGTITNQRVELNEYGKITDQVWNHLPHHFENLEIDAAVNYEHIIRNEKTLNILRQYIINNPWRWENDQLHPNNPSKW